MYISVDNFETVSNRNLMNVLDCDILHFLEQPLGILVLHNELDVLEGMKCRFFHYDALKFFLIYKLFDPFI